MVDTFGVVKLRLFTHSLDRFTSDGPFPLKRIKTMPCEEIMSAIGNVISGRIGC